MSREIEIHAAADADILSRAAGESRVVITLDRDFPQILALTGDNRPSVILIRIQRLPAIDLTNVIIDTWRQHEDSLMEGCLLKIGTRGTPIRPLPLR